MQINSTFWRAVFIFFCSANVYQWQTAHFLNAQSLSTPLETVYDFLNLI